MSDQLTGFTVTPEGLDAGKEMLHFYSRPDDIRAEVTPSMLKFMLAADGWTVEDFCKATGQQLADDGTGMIDVCGIAMNVSHPPLPAWPASHADVFLVNSVEVE